MLFLTVLLTECLMGAELELCVPSFPELRQLFGLSPFMAQLMLSLNFIAYCVALLAVGVVGDAFNRKRLIIWGLGLFIVGSAFSAMAQSYAMILLGRVLQGIGIAAPAALCYAALSDAYSREEQVSLMGWVHCFLGFAIAGSPVLGSYVTLEYGWRGNFVLLLLFAICCLLLALNFIKSGTVQGRDLPKFEQALKRYKVMLSSKKVWIYCFAICFLVNPYIVFVGFSAMLYVQDFGMSLEDFSLYQGSLALAFAVSSAFSGMLTRKFGLRRCFQVSIAMSCLHLVFLAFLVTVNSRDPMLITLCLILDSIAVSVPINVLIPYAFEAVENSRAGISALMMALRLVFSAILLWIVGYLYNNTFVPIGISMAVMTTTAIVLVVILLKNEPELQESKAVICKS